MIKAIYCDFDGCLSEEKPGAFIDLELVRYVRSINEKAAKDADIPFIAINSGRPQPFIEAQAQVFGISNYCVFENGSGIFKFKDDLLEVFLDPRIPTDIEAHFAEINHRIFDKFDIIEQHGKKYTISYIFQSKDTRISKIKNYVDSVILDMNLPYHADFGINFINVTTRGINKGTGLKLVSKKMEIPMRQIAGIGDSNGDWEFMKNCGFSACPSGASSSLKKNVDFVADFPTSEGTKQILEYIFENFV